MINKCKNCYVCKDPIADIITYDETKKPNKQNYIGYDGIDDRIIINGYSFRWTKKENVNKLFCNFELKIIEMYN